MSINLRVEDLFKKDIRRDIDGVIKVDKYDEDSVYTELEEYVVTQESLKHPDKIQDVDKEFEDSIVIGGRVFNKKIRQQRERLIREVKEKGYDQVIDEVTYTWFNRFVALKFMEVNGYLPVKVFSSVESGKQEPDILTKSLSLDFLNIDRGAVIDLKSAGKDEELYKYLTLSLCNYLNKIMPFLFESIEDHTELLFPDKLLHTDSVLSDLNGIIKEEDWKDGEGYIFDSSGPTAFLKDESNMEYLCSLLNTKISDRILSIITPTIHFNNGVLRSFPIMFSSLNETKSHINSLTQSCIDISREEWYSRETSWDFRKNELLHLKTSNRLKDAYDSYCSYWKKKFQKPHANEEELNRIFIDIYDLADELTPDVPLEDITILKDESEIKDGELVFKKDVIIKQFISYAVGCMFGRYSPDREGLILANKGETIKDFIAKVPAPSFVPDDDNIIPILEDEYFKDDIVSRFKEFLKVTFGAETIAENLDFIAGALSKSKKGGESSEKIIRDYFLRSFFKDHARTYKNRPIYWLFTSGKGRGFNALVYMHRYDKTTLAKMRTDYLLKLQDKLDARMGMLSSESTRDKQEKEKLSKLMEELAAYDEKLNNKALAYIDIDLDDGVAVNYAKFEGLVEGI